MPNLVRISADGSTDLLNTGMYGAGAVVRLQSSATETGTYASVGTAALVAGTVQYTVYDAAGTASTWYRSRYENVGATVTSDWSVSFQTGGEEGGQLCSLYDVKQRLGISPTDATKDEQILEFIDRVSFGIMSYTRRRFARNPRSGTAIFLFDVQGATRTLWAPKGIAEMTQLEVATQTGGAYTVVPTTDWFLDPPETERDHGWPATRITLSDAATPFSPGKRTVRATMAEGWASVSGDIAGIAEDEVIRRYQGRGQGYTAADSGEGFVRLLRNTSPADAERLDWYRVRSVA